MTSSPTSYRLSLLFFFFKQKTAYEMLSGDWSSDVCSSDLGAPGPRVRGVARLELWRHALRLDCRLGDWHLPPVLSDLDLRPPHQLHLLHFAYGARDHCGPEP